MKKSIAVILSLIMILSVFGCSSKNHDGEAKSPSGSSIQKGRNYQEVVKDFEEHGFTNIKTEKIEDLVTGWITKDGEVESVSIGGDTEYSPDVWYPSNVDVVISYHTFSANNQGEDSTSVDTETNAPESETLAINNCTDLQAILNIKSDIDPAYADFAKKYSKNTVQFDGCITYLVNHDSYKTRYDLLLSAGNYVDENTANPGPIFKLSDVGAFDLCGTTEMPSYIKIGANVVVTAKVKQFNQQAGVFELEIVKLEAR